MKFFFVVPDDAAHVFINAYLNSLGDDGQEAPVARAGMTRA